MRTRNRSAARSVSRLAAAMVAIGGAVAALDAPAGLRVAAAAAAEDAAWAAEFEAICSRTQDAMAIPTDELKSLVERCDRLAPTLAALDESRRKVYGKRLQLCRDLYAFVLETRAEAGQ